VIVLLLNLSIMKRNADVNVMFLKAAVQLISQLITLKPVTANVMCLQAIVHLIFHIMSQASAIVYVILSPNNVQKQNQLSIQKAVIANVT